MEIENEVDTDIFSMEICDFCAATGNSIGRSL